MDETWGRQHLIFQKLGSESALVILAEQTDRRAQAKLKGL